MSDSPSPSSSAAEGHRQRLRSRFLRGEAEALTEESLLELLLTFGIQRRDVQPLARKLLAEFGNLDAILSADPERLLKFNGIKENVTTLLKLIQHLRQNPVAAKEEAEPLSQPPQETPPPAISKPALAEPPPAETSPQTAAPARKASKTATKLQVSNGYSLDPAQNARLLTYIAEHPKVRKFVRRDIMDGTGLSEGQAESLASIGAAMNLVVPLTGVLTPWGQLVVKHDLFLDSPITLEYCHYVAASNPRNLVWHLVFNELLHSEKPTDQPGWSAWLRAKLAGQYSERSLIKHVAHEVRFLLDAYLEKCFQKLHLLHTSMEGTYALRRYHALHPLVLTAAIYQIGDQAQARLVQFSELLEAPGSPGRLFALDSGTMRQMLETVHTRGWIRFEARHGLDQIRLIDGFLPLDFLAAAYENTEPRPTAASSAPEPQGQLL